MVVVGLVLAGCSSTTASSGPSPTSGPSATSGAGTNPPATAPPATGSVPPGTVVDGSRRAAPVDRAFPDLGDPNLDVSHYDLALTYDVTGKTLQGRARIEATVFAASDSVSFDLRGLEVRAVRVDADEAEYRVTDRKLVVTPTARLRPSQPFRVEVTYGGTPRPVPTDALDGVEVGWHAGPDGSFVLAEPEGASTWFPVNNHPRDKATYSIDVTVPAPYVAIASGRLAGRDDATDGGHTYRWVMDRPMANYLATVVTGRFEEQRMGTHDGVAYSNWVPEGSGGEGGPFVALDVDVQRLETVLGPYPFSTYGAVVYPTSFITGSARTKRFLSGVALEAQGRSLYAEAAASGATVVHETAHQWMGDSVSLTDWSNDIWWIEGFARYSESIGGTGRAAGFRADYDEVRDKWIPPAHLARSELFSYGSYTEGSLVFYALEQEVGRETFDRILATFTDRYRDANATTDDLVAVASEVSGRDLRSFFAGWLDAPTPPPFPA